VRARALQVFEQMLAAAVDAYDEIVDEALTPTGLDLDAGQAQRFRAVAEVIDNVATEIYFASGAHVDQSEARQPRLEEPKRRRFYHEAATLLDTVTRVRWPASAVHHVLETLHEQVVFDPRGVLLRIGRLVRSARAWATKTTRSRTAPSWRSSRPTSQHTASCLPTSRPGGRWSTRSTRSSTPAGRQRAGWSTGSTRRSVDPSSSEPAAATPAMRESRNCAEAALSTGCPRTSPVVLSRRLTHASGSARFS
jgi:hypothetical protein